MLNFQTPVDDDYDPLAQPGKSKCATAISTQYTMEALHKLNTIHNGSFTQIKHNTQWKVYTN